jgi:hypothetical protein
MIIGTGIVLLAHSSQFQIWTSVPQIAVLAMRTSTSSGPISGTGSSRSTRPGPDCAFTSARMGRLLVDYRLVAMPMTKPIAATTPTSFMPVVRGSGRRGRRLPEATGVAREPWRWA